MTESFTKHNPADYLTSPEAIAEFITDALETADAAYIANALGIVARAKGMTKLAEQTGLPREQLYKSFSEQGNPTLKSLLVLLQAIGVQLTVQPQV